MANHALGYPASTLSDFPAPTPISLRPCGFNASRFLSATLFRWKRRSFGTFVVCSSFSHVPGPKLKLLSRPGGTFSLPRRSWDCLILRSFAPPDSSVRVFALLGPHAVVHCVRREFHRRGIEPITDSTRDLCRGFWDLSLSSSRAVLFAGPAIAFARRADQIQLAVAALDFLFLSQVFTTSLRPSLLGPIRP